MASSSSGAPVAGPRWNANRSSWPTSGRPLVANQSAARRPAVESTDTPHVPDWSTASRKRASLSTQTSTDSGSSETDVNALAVIAWSMPSCRVVTTVTPEGKWPTVRRNTRPSPADRTAGRAVVRAGSGAGPDVAGTDITLDSTRGRRRDARARPRLGRGRAGVVGVGDASGVSPGAGQAGVADDHGGRLLDEAQGVERGLTERVLDRAGQREAAHDAA